MSLVNPIRKLLALPNVDILTYGESHLYGYDCLNECLIKLPFNELNDEIRNENLIHLYFSSKPKYSIEKLILNQDETIIALISHQTVSLVYLPQLQDSTRQNSCFCPLNEVNSTLSNRLIDFLWLSPKHFLLVNSTCSSECHLYAIRSSKINEIDHVQIYSVGLSSVKGRTSCKGDKRISLNRPSDIIQLSLCQRKQDDNSIVNLIFALKSNGDLFLMEIDQKSFDNSSDLLCNTFVGPIRIIPSRQDNYGANYTHSNIFCLSNKQNPIVILIRDRCQINEMILLNPDQSQYYLYTIDFIQMPTNQTIEHVVIDQLNSNKYYLTDCLSNIYSLDLFWIDQISSKDKKPFEQTNLQHLTRLNQPIQQVNLIQLNNKGQWISLITKTANKQQKELVLFRENFSSIRSELSSVNGHASIKSNSSEFINRIRLILRRNESLPDMSNLPMNLSNDEFSNYLIDYLQRFSQDYLDKQDKVRMELENKQKHFSNFQQTQLVAYQELIHKFELLKDKFENQIQLFKQESQRRKDNECRLDDLLSVIESRTPVLSKAESSMFEQLQRYEIQIKFIKEKISLLQKHIYDGFDSNQQRIDQTLLESMQQFTLYYRDQIQMMKHLLQTHQDKS